MPGTIILSPDPLPATDPLPAAALQPGQGDFGSFSSDPDYKKLLESYQNGDLQECEAGVTALLQKYPYEEILLEFQEDIRVRLEFRQQHLKGTRAHRRTRVFRWFAILLAIGGVLALGVYGFQWATSTVLYNMAQALVVSTPDTMAALAQLESQVRSLIQIGNSAKAAEIIEQIRAIDSTYPALDDLTNQVAQLTELDARYEEAMQLVTEQDLTGALAILKEIEAQNPTYKDAAHQISLIEKQVRVDELLQTADQAYADEQWEQVILAYEELLTIDPSITPPDYETHLFNSYYHAINDLLNTEQPSSAVINQAEKYYLKSLQVAPQRAEFATQREELRLLVSDLLLYKYRHYAEELINNQDVSENSVTIAIDYLNKALALAPDNHDIKTDLEDAQTYLSAIKKFNAKDWDSAITILESITYFNQGYANGMVKLLLFEAYSARANRFYNVGFYNEARRDYEAAEINAWDHTSNATQLFQVQMQLGFTLGRMHYYQEADSYFSYALKLIDVPSIVEDQALLDALSSAQTLYEAFNYMDAYVIYAESLSDLSVFYSPQQSYFHAGDSLAYIAGAFSSTIDKIRASNNLSDAMLLSTDMVLSIPFIAGVE
jgi:tetratricopeptide (TPR) repeat protein